ncbi:DNA-directed RNA polymerase subunit beta [Thermoflavimicrobium dichotomicum]|uniref:DNA-directed RNA polymerase subunit beta n=1 Tax=Thermoflavimicrobium dichotomicum TaxID=46223 RepID=A0A1I3K075_9BACL|nr:DNA-directed RNA polymerase subunit beta [Thermoflavimicrobium dichotomicum]
MENAKDQAKKKQTDTLLSVGKLKWSKDEGNLPKEPDSLNLEKGKETIENKNDEEIQNKKEEKQTAEQQINSSTSGLEKEKENKGNTNFEENTFVRLSGFATEDESIFQPKEESNEKGKGTVDPSSSMSDEPAEKLEKADKELFFTEKPLEKPQENQVEKLAPSLVKSPDTKQPKITEQPKEEKSTAKRIWKILWLPLTLIVVLIVGLIIGHSVLGGQPASGVFDMGMWEHLYKLIFTK